MRRAKIIARPFHKFFNLGEKQQIGEIDWSLPHQVFDKLDGSMVHPAMLGGEMVMMTRMGVTEQSRKAATHAGAGALELSRHLVDSGITPIFEFTSPDNRIVVAYDRPALTLLAAREMISGAYLSSAELARLAAQFDVPLVRSLGSLSDVKSFVAKARGEEGIEGYVIAFETGHRVKLKTEGYVLRHKALAGLQYEKNVLAWVATDAVDDVVPILSPELAAAVLAYRDQVNSSAVKLVAMIDAFLTANRDLSRKDFALKANAELDQRVRGAAFRALDGKSPAEAITQLLQASTGSDTRVEGIRDLFHMSWQVEGLALPEMEG